jgi:hypothetical protein
LAGRKWLKNFLRRNPQISVITPEGLPLSRARGFTPESVFPLFFNVRTCKGHHSTQSCKTSQLRRNRHPYCTAQTHENISIERQASDNFSSIRRTGVPCDSRHLYESNWTLHSTVTCKNKKKYERRSDEWLTDWTNPRVPSPLGGYRARFFPSGFFISSNIQRRQKKILLS